MTNFRKGRLDELPRRGGGLINSHGSDTPRLPLGRDLAAPQNHAAIGRGRRYFAVAKPASPAANPQRDFESLLEALFASPQVSGVELATQDNFCSGSQTPSANDAFSRSCYCHATSNSARKTGPAVEELALEEPEPEAANSLAPTFIRPLPITSEAAELNRAESVPAATALFEPSDPSQLQHSDLEGAPESVQMPSSASFLSALLASTEKRNREPQSQDELQPVPAPVRKSNPAPSVNALMRAWEWLRNSQKLTSKRQLRVSDTVGLGDKRFVALLHFEGRKFLIGGGGANVSLLSELGQASVISGATQAALLQGSTE